MQQSHSSSINHHNLQKSSKLPPLRNSPASQPPSPEAPRFPNDAMASFGGHGTAEALEVIQLLDGKGISACMCGVSALKYYGAPRLRQDWEICVPTDKFKDAEAVFHPTANPADYVSVPSWPSSSILHTYPRFKRRGIHFYFVLIPDWDVHFECSPSNFCESSNGIPYPKLHVLMQSYIDTQDQLSLVDLIDGTNVSEQWGLENLELDGGTDLDWARKKKTLMASTSSGNAHNALGLFTQAISRRALWEKLVRTKGARRGWKQPEHLFVTQYRLHGSPDPWVQDRSCS